MSLPYSTTVKLLPIYNTYIQSYLSVRDLLRCREVIISLVSAVTRKFMQGRHLVGTSDQNTYQSRLVQNDPARPT
jgi:hypothetical protein